MSLYAVAVPTFKRSLTSLKNILQKAEAFATEKKIEPSVLINARLAPDMFPLKRQVQIATDSARRGVGQLAGIEVPSEPDVEETFEQLYARIDRTIAYLDKVDAKKFEGADKKTIELPLPGGTMKLDGVTFLTAFSMANFSFHVVTAYNILRHNGVPIGKMDYLGRP